MELKLPLILEKVAILVPVAPHRVVVVWEETAVPALAAGNKQSLKVKFWL